MGLPENITTAWLVFNLIVGAIISLCIGGGLFMLVLPFLLAGAHI